MESNVVNAIMNNFTGDEMLMLVCNYLVTLLLLFASQWFYLVDNEPNNQLDLIFPCYIKQIIMVINEVDQNSD